MTGSEWFGSRPGGLNRYFAELHEALAEQDGVNVRALAFGEPPLNGRTWGPTGLSFLRRVAQATVDVESADVIDRHFSLYGRLPLRSARRASFLNVVHFHGPWSAESLVSGGRSFTSRTKRRIEKIRYASADVIIVLSDAFKELLIRDYEVPASKVRVIPPGVRMLFDTGKRTTPDHPVVLCVRRLERRMGIDDLLDAWRVVHEAYPDAELRIIGDGSEREALRAQSITLGLEGTVKFLGRTSDSDLHEEYLQSTLTVVPTRALEGFGLIALESLVRGKAPIVTNCGGLPDSVRGLDPSLVVEPASPEQLAERLVAGIGGLIPSAEECRRHAGLFSWERAAKAHVAVYEEILASRK